VAFVAGLAGAGRFARIDGVDGDSDGVGDDTNFSLVSVTTGLLGSNFNLVDAGVAAGLNRAVEVLDLDDLVGGEFAGPAKVAGPIALLILGQSGCSRCHYRLGAGSARKWLMRTFFYFSLATTYSGAQRRARLISESGKMQMALRADSA
jgi:hypothetical protein